MKQIVKKKTFSKVAEADHVQLSVVKSELKVRLKLKA